MLLELGNQRGIVLLAGADRLVHHLDRTVPAQVIAGLFGEALPVSGLVMYDRNSLTGEILGQEGAGDSTLLVVTPADTKNIFAALVGQLRVG